MRRRLMQVAVVLTVGFVFAGVGALHAQTERSTVAVAQAELKQADVSKTYAPSDLKEADHSTDLRPIIAKKSLREGVNFITQTPEGLRVYAVVQVTDINVKDASGRELERLEQRPQRTAKRPQSGSVESHIAVSGGGTSGDEPRCWHCYEINGETHCFEIKCPFITASGSGAEP